MSIYRHSEINDILTKTNPDRERTIVQPKPEPDRARAEEQMHIVSNKMKDDGYLSDEELAELISKVESEGLRKAPRGLKEEVMLVSDEIRAKREERKKHELLSFSIKIAVGTAAAVFLLMVIPAGNGTAMWTDPTRFETTIENQNKRTKDVTEKIENKVDLYKENMTIKMNVKGNGR
jgi:hypothetical protein